MRHLFKFLFTIIITLGIAYLFLCMTMIDNPSELGQAVNQFSIIAKEEPKYVKIDNTNARDEAGYGNYEYSLKSYDQKGKEHPVKFTGMGKLKQGHYLKLTTKGTYVITYEEAFENNIPEAAFSKLNQN